MNFIRRNKVMICKCAVSFLTPFILAFLYLMFRGISLKDLFLPNSVNNDTLFYYKLVEGMIKDGMPLGYFGFNESHALRGSLGAWSPVIFIPWCLWGLLFGWGYGSMLISNLVYFGLALLVFTLLVQPEWKNIVAFMILGAMFPSLSIHMLSGLPEVIITSVLILFWGLTIAGRRAPNNAKYVVWLFLVCGILTMMRPYMVVCMLVPAMYFAKNRWQSTYLVSGAIAVGFLALYFTISRYYTAPYFEPLFDLSLFEKLAQKQFMEAWSALVGKVTFMLPALKQYLWNAFSYGMTAGTQYVIALAVAAFLGILFLLSSDEEKKVQRGMFTFLCICLLGAVIILLGKANEGGRHYFMFAVTGLLLLAQEVRYNTGRSGCVMIGILLVIFLRKGAMVPTDYDVPVRDEVLVQELAYWQQSFAQQGIAASEEISYDNTVMWLLSDLKDGNYQVVNHRGLYALPKSFGVNCCLSDYVAENWENLQCKYIATMPGGRIDDLCQSDELKEIGRTENLVIYAYR